MEKIIENFFIHCAFMIMYTKHFHSIERVMGSYEIFMSRGFLKRIAQIFLIRLVMRSYEKKFSHEILMIFIREVS